jgi:hypothetical protein
MPSTPGGLGGCLDDAQQAIGPEESLSSDLSGSGLTRLRRLSVDVALQQDNSARTGAVQCVALHSTCPVYLQNSEYTPSETLRW